MKYISTRGGLDPQSFSNVVLEGLAPDGGLVVPQTWPRFTLDQLENLRHLNYTDLAFEIISQFATDIPDEDLKEIINRAYTFEKFGSNDITPLVTIDSSKNLYLLAVSNGPTLAFKDIAMQFLGELFPYLLAKKNQTLNILGATSGDTGSAAEVAMQGKKGVTVTMLSPLGRMSDFQKAQMYSITDENIHNIAIEGSFDDCQDIVKAVSHDLEFKRKHNIGTVNSINLARVIAQVVYYFKGYFAATSHSSEKVSFTVPSGNFGNIYAAFIAKKIGLPIDKSIVATNENNVLEEFFNTGIYRVRPKSDITSSPSMDIAKASNFERFIFDVLGESAEKVKELWSFVEQKEQIQKQGYAGFDLSNQIDELKQQTGFLAGVSSHQQRLDCIAQIYQNYQLLIDPHTADGINVAMDYLKNTENDTSVTDTSTPMICLETALPAKFSDVIKESLGFDAPIPQRFEYLAKASHRVIEMPCSHLLVKKYLQENVV
jgi:threonine synthase